MKLTVLQSIVFFSVHKRFLKSSSGQDKILQLGKE